MTILLGQVERELRTIIETDGADHVYERPEWVQTDSGQWIKNQGACLYVHVDRETGAVTEGCIVGAWLARFHGVDLTGLTGLQADARELITDGVITLDIDPDALIVLRQVQIHQDNGNPWGYALEKGLTDWREGDYEDAEDEDEDEDDDEDDDPTYYED